MERSCKKRSTVQIVIGLAAACLLFLLAAAPVLAASPRVQWYNGELETDITVEAGSKFYIGDFVSILGENVSSTASLVKASYRTGDRKVASVNGKGFLNVKKAGTTDVTVVCQGTTLICHLTVEKKNTFEQTTAVKKLKEAAKILAKGLPKKLNAAKGYNLRKKRDAYFSTYGHMSARALAYDGFLYEKERVSQSTMSAKRSEKLAVPEAGRYLTAEALLRQFLLTNNPVSIKSAKTMRIASVTANLKSGKFTIKLTQKLKAEQIFAAQLAFPRLNTNDTNRKQADITMTIYDETAGIYYQGFVKLKQGAKQFTVQPVESVYGGYKNVELVKDHVYMLESGMSWANGTKVTVK